MAKELTYRDVLKDKEYRKLLFTNLINRFGDSLDAIAFTWLVYQITHSASWAALIYGLNVLPNIVVQPLFGAVVEKMDKKKVIIASHLARGVVISLFVFLYLKGSLNPYIMAAFTLIITTIESLNLPASTAFIPRIIKKEYLSHAMSLNSSLSSAVSLIGTGLAGVIIAVFGVQSAMLIDAATFFIAAIGVFSLKELEEVKAADRQNANDNAPAKAPEKESFILLLKGGFKYISGNKVLLNYCFVAVILNFFLVPLNSLQAPIAEDCYGLGSEFLSIIGMTASLGSILGSAIVPKIMEKFSAKQSLITCGMFLGIFMYILSLGRLVYGQPVLGYLLAGASFFMMCLAASVIGGTLNIQFIKTVDKDYLARAASVFNASSTAATPLGSLITTFVAVRLSTSFILGLCGILATVLFIILAISRMDFDFNKRNEDGITDAA